MTGFISAEGKQDIDGMKLGLWTFCLNVHMMLITLPLHTPPLKLGVGAIRLNQ
jgi:hypothetical protein